MVKLLITKHHDGTIAINGTQNAEVILVEEDTEGGLKAQVKSCEKLRLPDFRNHVWDSLAAGLDEKSAAAHNITLSADVLKYLMNLNR